MLLAGNALTAILAAAILEFGVVRPAAGSPGSGSITTLFPGLVYACATVMKVCLAAGTLCLTIALGRWTLHLVRGAAPSPSVSRIPLWGLSCISLAPCATVVGAATAVTYQRVAFGTDPISVVGLQSTGSNAVQAMLVVLCVGVVTAAVSLIRREKPVWTTALGLAVNALLIGLCLYLRFHTPGFDQDRWAH